MTEKRRLGRGLGALIPEAMAEDSNLKEISLEKIRPNPFQPRDNFDQEKLEELAASIKEHGVVQPIIVSPEKDGYLLVAGERRYRAAKLAGLHTIPAVVKKLDSSTILQVALIENLQREDLNAIEEAIAYKQLIEQFGFTQEELAIRLGKSRSAIANTLRLLSLPEEIKADLVMGRLTPGQARPLLSIQEKSKQLELAHKIAGEGLSAREAERLAARLASGKKDTGAAARQDKEADPLLDALEEKLQHYFGTRVKILRKKDGGSIAIDFYNEEDLERLIYLLVPEGLG